MEKKAIDLSHLVFMELIRTIISTVGVSAAKGSLMRIAIQAGEQSMACDFPDFQSFYESMDSFDNPISRLEGRAQYLGNGLFGLPECPFSSLLGHYSDFYGSSPQGFESLADEFNKKSKVSDKYRVGTGAAVGPFCVFHQPMRSQVGAQITIGGKKIEIFQLGCRSSGGKKGCSQEFINEFGCSLEDVEKVLDTNMCCYGVKVRS